MAEASPQRLPALHELEMLSPWFDASAPALTPAVDPATSQGKRRLLLLLSAPRSGSYHLCRLLWHLGYGKPAEYFNPICMPAGIATSRSAVVCCRSSAGGCGERSSPTG